MNAPEYIANAWAKAGNKATPWKLLLLTPAPSMSQ